MSDISFPKHSRRKSRSVKVGTLAIGGTDPVSIQSMTTTKTEDIEATIAQILELQQQGCDLVRCTINNKAAARAIPAIKRAISIPLVADIHFDHRLALMAVEAGIDKIRINPGNIGQRQKMQQVLDACRINGIPIRIGVNAGSLEQNILEQYRYPCAEAMVDSALGHIRLCEKNNFTDIIVSLKSSHTQMMIDAYIALASIVDYPLHLGVTEAGTRFSGTIKSAIGIGSLLSLGIGDTIRVSLTDHPSEEVRVGKEILKALGYQSKGIDIVSCPTCGRLQVDLIKIANEIEKATMGLDKSLRVAVMGCIVNGPGEASDADIGVACAKNQATLFIRGEKKAIIPESEIVATLLREIENF